MSFLKKIFSSAYDELWKAVIRPNRDKYSDIELGPEKFELKGKCYKRTDFTLTNKKNYKLICSFWEPFDEEREFPKLPCVIYLHGNSSSRCEVVPEIKYLLKIGITVFAFDFSGCGRSEGEYISLGWHEQDDVACIVDFLRRSNKVSAIGLWGRSMGAATALMYATKDLSIAGLVLDSPFSSLKNLINELAKDRVALPDFVVKQALKWIKETIKEKADFNLDDVEPIEYANKCFIPAYFCHSKGDTFVNIHHCKDLYNLYAGDKNIVYVKGNHNSERSIHFKESVGQFFYKALRCEEMEQKSEFNSIINLEFHNDDNNFCKKILDLRKKKNIRGQRQTNNSVSEIKICGKFENKKEIEFNNEKIETKLIEDDPDLIFCNDDNIIIHDINECPKLKTNNKYINKKRINSKPTKSVDYINSIVKSCKSSSSKNIHLTTNEVENKIKNEDDEKQKLFLSSKEIDEIKIKVPNYLNNNNRSSIKKFNKEYKYKSNKNNKYNEVKKTSIETISYESKYKFFPKENINVNNDNKTINQTDERYKRKIHLVKDLKRRRNLLLEQLKNKNNIFDKKKQKNKLFIKSNNAKASSVATKYPKTMQREINFPNLILHIKNHENNIKQINNNKINNNHIKINQVYNIKTKEGKIKSKENKEQNKNISLTNSKKSNFVQRITNDKNINKNKSIINKNKEENKNDNSSEKTFKNNDNKLSDSHFFQENEDDFFLEDDNIKINIPHI